jgi:uncharacterized protein YjbJ (UPF0337 family)
MNMLLSSDYATIKLDRPVSMPNAMNARGKWRRDVSDAGVVWDRLTENDLQRLEGHQETLTELVRERYGVSRDEADQQVMTFIEDHQSYSL